MRNSLIVLRLSFFAMITMMLTSCQVEVHWFEHRTFVPWYVVWIPVVFILLIAHICVINREYKCPKCGTVFRPKWYAFSAWLHMDSKRVVRCPSCGFKGFCEKNE